MAIKNLKGLLVDASKFPAAIEAKLPEGAPKISTTLIDIAGKLPAVPDFPMELPDLPAPPELPELPVVPGGAGLPRVFVGPIEAAPVVAGPTPARTPVTPLVQAYTQPIEGVVAQVTTRRGM